MYIGKEDKGADMKTLAAEYRESVEGIRRRIEELESVRRESDMGALDSDILARRIIRLRTMLCDTALVSRFMAGRETRHDTGNEFIGVRAYWG